MFDDHKKNTEYEVNNRAYQNTLIRMNQNHREEPWNLIQFVIKT